MFLYISRCYLGFAYFFCWLWNRPIYHYHHCRWPKQSNTGRNPPPSSCTSFEVLNVTKYFICHCTVHGWCRVISLFDVLQRRPSSSQPRRLDLRNKTIMSANYTKLLYTELMMSTTVYQVSKMKRPINGSLTKGTYKPASDSHHPPKTRRHLVAVRDPLSSYRSRSHRIRS